MTKRDAIEALKAGARRSSEISSKLEDHYRRQEAVVFEELVEVLLAMAYSLSRSVRNES